jgi:multicomponent Na+:H+ antiporter subunit D
MPSVFLLIIVLFPIFSAALIPVFRLGNGSKLKIYVFAVTALTSLSVLSLFVFKPVSNLVLKVIFADVSPGISFSLGFDGASAVFSVMIAILWPLASLYSFEYMKDERFHTLFYVFYTATYGVTLGIALSANLFTLYIFYEFLTISTLPLVMHVFNDKSIRAGRKYMYYSLGGAAFAFIGLLYVINYAGSTDFVLGGIFKGEVPPFFETVYLLTFMGFGVKAAVFPLHDWLPSASVAPTPVTALLHAVAVVKSGAFAIIRMTYYCFGTQMLEGSWAQYTVIGISLFTVLMGSVLALKESHFKRRLAYSTVGNLSYILFAASLMTPEGLLAAFIHMLAHGITKSLGFFAAGAIMKKTGKEYVYDLDGLYKSMPFTCICYCVSAVSLVGIPPFACFISKWNICLAALHSNSVAGYLGMAVIIISAMLTGFYMFTPAIRMFSQQKNNAQTNVCDPQYTIKITLALLAFSTFIFGILASPITSGLNQLIFGA